MTHSKMELNNTKNKNRIIIVLLVLVLSIFLIACKKDVDVDKNKDKEITYDDTVFPEEMKASLKGKKVYVTSIGQSKDIEEYKEVVLDNVDYFTYEVNNFLEASDVDDDSAVLLFVGCSIKALAASELTLDDEIARANAFVSKCRRGKISLICIHIGGLSRRGATSDQLIESLFPYANMNIYLSSGNEDGLLSDLSHKNNVYAYEITTTLELIKATELLFKGE